MYTHAHTHTHARTHTHAPHNTNTHTPHTHTCTHSTQHTHAHTHTAPSSLVSQSASLGIPSSSQQLMRLRAEQTQNNCNISNNITCMAWKHKRLNMHTLWVHHLQRHMLTPGSEAMLKGNLPIGSHLNGCLRLQGGGHWSPRQPLVVNLSKVQIVVIANTTCCVVHFNFTEFTILAVFTNQQP